MNMYSYDGPVMEFDNCVANRWIASTRAVSEKKARSNLTYQLKRKTNRTSGYKDYIAWKDQFGERKGDNLMEEYKPNSHKSKEEQKNLVPEKRVEKVISGTVKSKKKSEMQKFADVFISEDVNNVKSYIVMDVLVPAIKKAISDIVTNGIDMILYGETGKSKKELYSVQGILSEVLRQRKERLYSTEEPDELRI